MALNELYVSSTAAGMMSGTLQYPWPLDTGIANAISGDRVNIKNDGEYNFTGDLYFSNYGNINLGIYYRGYTDDIDDGGRATINFNSSGSLRYSGRYCRFENLNIVSENATAPTFLCNDNVAGPSFFNNCLIENKANYAAFRHYGYEYIYFNTCSLISLGGAAAELQDIVLATKTSFIKKQNNSSTYLVQVDNGGSFSQCIFDAGNSSTPCVDVRSTVLFAGCVFCNSTSAGVLLRDHNEVLISDSVFYNLNYGIGDDGTYSGYSLILIKNNAMGAITSSRIQNNGGLVEFSPIIITLNPFKNLDNHDYRLNSYAGGGAECRNIKSLPPDDLLKVGG